MQATLGIPGRAGRFATWGVRVGWLAQTGLLAVQAERSDGFPWDTWAGSLEPVRLARRSRPTSSGAATAATACSGSAVLPPAVCLLVAAWLGGATKTHADGAYSSAFLVLHVGLVLAAFAGFTRLGRARRALPLAGAAAEAPPCGRAARPGAVARHSSTRSRAG